VGLKNWMISGDMVGYSGAYVVTDVNVFDGDHAVVTNGLFTNEAYITPKKFRRFFAVSANVKK